MIPPDVRKIATASDAARARSAAARLTAAQGAPGVERARFLTALTQRLRQCLDGDGAELTLTVEAPGPDGAARVQAVVRPLPPGGRTSPSRFAVSCPGPVPRSLAHPADPDDPASTDAVLAADEETAAVLRRLDEVEELFRLHREELHRTDQGVLALHAELDAAALVQRDLLDAERATRGEAEKARRLLTFLTDASAAVTASLDHEDILLCLSDQLVPRYASQVDVWLFGENRAASGGARSAAAVTAARTGRPQHAGRHPGGLPGTEDLPPSALSPGRPVLCIPLTVRRTLGVLTLTAPGHRFDADTGVMLVELARRIAIALENALRYEQHRDTAETLQRAQLTDLPTADGLRLAARYLPATRGLNIGGDWYDAFFQPDGSLLTVIGDVTGHGLHAAVVMGQLRTALRAYAVDGAGPAEILTRLHRMLRHQEPDLYATAMIARLRPGEHRVTWASAGHPPAVVRAPRGAVRVLGSKPGVMLGVPIPFTYRDRTTGLEPGSTLVLYTDGLVERRSQGIDTGIELLGRTLAALDEPALEDLDRCAESLVEPLVRASERDDDVCLLLCHSTPPETVPQPAHGERLGRPTGVPRPARAFGEGPAPR
ncbi:PP2C family protein-serine/threonine phosphatase [Streptomyces marokkonensis]|uniref:PP2C family protein-serine/threonine phosphatase n=1 Tax=Streptomyces marokkonensis TaxID=324855 RepID=UPI0011F199FD|nr:SpoIIE family protein phosphatase [Streptomyces marokkonensis]